jgi:hypothetical protein
MHYFFYFIYYQLNLYAKPLTKIYIPQPSLHLPKREVEKSRVGVRKAMAIELKKLFLSYPSTKRRAQR